MIGCGLAFDVKYNTTDEPKSKNTHAQDVSAGGVAFRTEKKYPEGTYVRLKLSQPDLTNELEFVGRVVRSLDRDDRIYTAIEFTEVKNRSHKGGKFENASAIHHLHGRHTVQNRGERAGLMQISRTALG